jgi:hypothetical protein
VAAIFRSIDRPVGIFEPSAREWNRILSPSLTTFFFTCVSRAHKPEKKEETPTASNQAESTVHIDLVPEFVLVIFKGEARVSQNSTFTWKSNIVHLHLKMEHGKTVSHFFFLGECSVSYRPIACYNQPVLVNPLDLPN